MVKIRPFEKRDQAAVYELVQAGLKERWGEIFDPQYNRDLEDIQGFYLDTLRAIVVVMTEDDDDQAIIGSGILFPLPAPNVFGSWRDDDADAGSGDSKKVTDVGECRMTRVSIVPGRRGQGLSKMIVRHLIEQGRLQGRKRILVETTKGWESAIGLYRALQFEVVHEDDECLHFKLDL
ncbi:hypothetical protein DFQ27_008682 [Actinomortierella ambigua]|uniref:N-acetyltransferase domain-containing protein n=1 Tax=Actinomortierella ambigua TaxID=1343610 RepID=A0A9P6QHX9_9FUNG|nr:hypothetical protein DFQ27_008682 [Actinomortierella ambigua]